MGISRSLIRKSSNPIHTINNIWITTPGSINERRKQLLEGMGLASDKKDLLSLKRFVSNKVNTNGTISSPPPTTTTKEEHKQQQDTTTTPHYREQPQSAMVG